MFKHLLGIGLLALFALCLSSCGKSGLLGTEGTGLLINDETEAEIGGEVHLEVLNEYPLYENQTVDDWVTELGGQLAAASATERDGVTYRFFVLDSEIVNAFAAPGGYIYLTRGLILEADTEAEIAGVLGHEIGHVAHRHGIAKIERALAIGALADLILGDGIANDVVLFATNFVLSTDYSQAQETDADDLGVLFTHGAAINPFGLVDFFLTLSGLSGESLIPDWMSSHPQPEERAERAEQNIAALPGEVTRTSQELRWEPTGQFEQIQDLLQFNTPYDETYEEPYRD